MNFKSIFAIGTLCAAMQLNALAQNRVEDTVPGPMPVPASTNPAAVEPASEPEIRPNTAIIPVSRTGGIVNRQNLVLERARSAPGDYDIAFIGDSITQNWESVGAPVWKELGAKYKLINLGVAGDRTQHILWRFEQGQLEGLKARVAVVLIGTNNTGKGRNTPAEIVAGISAIVQQIRLRQPATKILLLGIFPRGKTFNEQRADALQVNQVLARLSDDEHVFYLDFGSQLIEDDGSISESIMKDHLHIEEKGYRIWASATAPKLKEMLGEK